jgi:hypothetical protein
MSSLLARLHRVPCGCVVEGGLASPTAVEARQGGVADVDGREPPALRCLHSNRRPGATQRRRSVAARSVGADRLACAAGAGGGEEVADWEVEREAWAYCPEDVAWESLGKVYLTCHIGNRFPD